MSEFIKRNANSIAAKGGWGGIDRSVFGDVSGTCFGFVLVKGEWTKSYTGVIAILSHRFLHVLIRCFIFLFVSKK